jgi:hypothetical protein
MRDANELRSSRWTSNLTSKACGLCLAISAAISCSFSNAPSCAVVGGLILGIGAQVFILPYLDSITGFIVLFVAVSAVAAWFAASSPRLSYFGVQIIVAFYLINLQGFKEQISLGVARDRVVAHIRPALGHARVDRNEESVHFQSAMAG